MPPRTAAEALLPAAHGPPDLPRTPPDEVRLRIEAQGTRVELAAGEWLVRQGDEADSMYVVLSGRLEVVVDDAPCASSDREPSSGELALLTGGRRRRRRARGATRSCSSFGGGSSSACSSGPRRPPWPSQPRSPRQLATARPPEPSSGGAARWSGSWGWSRSDPAVAVAPTIARGLARHCDVSPRPASAPSELAAAEQLHDRVVLVAEAPDPEWWRACVRQSDRVIVVAAAPTAAARAVGRTGQADLVLVGPRADHDGLRAWIEVMRPWQV